MVILWLLSLGTLGQPRDLPSSPLPHYPTEAFSSHGDMQGQTGVMQLK